MNSNIAGLCSGVDLIDWIGSWFTINDSLAAVNKELVDFASFTLWQIWKLRCAVVFDNAQVNIPNIVCMINHNMNEWVVSNSNRSSISQQGGAHMRVHIPWTRPSENFIKVNFDASYSKDSNLMGTGLIVVDDAGKWRTTGCIPAVAQDVEKAEAQVAL
ncbi:uncharacterized protein LOC113312182 [Papaver somniferum]|uniref:uncharacterized protein LOC113312182 n=1 Tax=Papaver somniferum TaxID=3469 RepID=UPI000E7031D7|nr:uncharacterized protein LOC113312182 [Papaver somniferum]